MYGDKTSSEDNILVFMTQNHQNSTIFTITIELGETKIIRSGKRSGLTIFYISQKIPCVGFWREIGLKIFKILPFLLIQLNWPKFTNFGHLFLKKMTNNWIQLQWSCNLLLIWYLLWAKWKKMICGHSSIFYVKVSPKNPLFVLCS